VGCLLVQSYEVALLVSPLQANVSSKNDVECYGDSTGSAAITVTGGSGPFTYLWMPGAYTSSSMTGLSAGNYTVSVIDNGACSQSTMVSFTINQPSDSIAISLTPSSINAFNLSCFGSNDGSIASTISGGTPPYNYTWSGPNGFSSSNPTISSLQAGFYSLMISDQNGCTASDTITLAQPDQITITYLMTPASCPTPGSNDGSISITVNGGVPGYIFNWTGPSGFTSTDEDISNLEAGVYQLTIEDAISCLISISITVTQPDNFFIDPTLSTYPGGWNVSCFSYSDGGIDVDVSNVAPPIQYSWNYNGTEISTDTLLQNVPAGNYELIITDANNCIENRFYNLIQPDSILIDFDAFTDAYGNSISCYGNTDGELTATISGGTPAYSFLWTYPDNSTSNDALIQDLASGVYSLSITDLNSCLGFDSIYVAEPDSLTISLMSPDTNGYNVTCFNGNDGSIITTVNGGTPPFLFQWVYPSGGIGSTDQNPGNLQAGTYILLLSDVNSCTATDTITLVASDAITYTSIISDFNGYNVPCSGDSLADVEIIPTGGTPPYFVVWDNGDTTTTRNGLSAGTYNGLIYDSQNCIGQLSVDIIEPPIISVDFTISSYLANFQLQCNGDSSGYIYATINGGTPPYAISWTGPNAFSSSQDSISNLIAGDYTILITDQNACQYSQIVSLDEPDSLSLSIQQINFSSCASDSNSSLLANTSGGVAGYSYSWTGPNGFTASSQIITGLDAGIYCVEVMDQNACSKVACFEIIDPSPLSISLNSPLYSGVNILCNGDSSGSINSLVSGGIPPYSYSWTGPIGSNPIGPNPINLIAGVYNLSITDSIGCISQASIVLTEADEMLNSISTSDYNGFGVSCFGSSDGQLIISTLNGTAPYSYSWSDESGPIGANDTLFALASGSYFVEVMDANSCLVNDSVFLSSPDSLAIALISPEYYPGINISCKNGDNGSIESVVAGGVTDYSYSWTGPNSFISTDSALNQLSAGWYYLDLIDMNGCTGQDSIELVAPDSLLHVDFNIDIKNSGTNITCFDGNDGSVAIHISGGIPGYQVYWLGPNGFSSNDTLIENLVAGTYFLSVVDSVSCTYSEEIILTQPIDSLSAQNTLTNNTCFGDSSASIELIVSGGSFPYLIDWQGPNGFASNAFLIDNLGNGEYSYVLYDTNGCTVFDTLMIASEAMIEANEIIQNINCSGDSDGSIILNPSGGGNSYSYSWTGPDGFISDLQTINNLDSGEYCVTIETELLCSTSFCYFISESDSLYYLDSLLAPTCGYANGAIFIEPMGGTPPYIVDWGFQTGNNLIDVASGFYSGNIIDSLGCTINLNYELIGPDSIMVNDSLINNSCFESDDASIMVDISGGSPEYEILWLGPAGFSSMESTIDSLSNGTYQLSIVDSLGCSFFESYEITSPNALEAIIYSPLYPNNYNISAYGNNDGSIETSDVNGGTPLYTYLWEGPNGFSSTDASLTQLFAGNYILQITDMNACIYLDSIYLIQPESTILPTGFTPNNDGYNDLYVVPGINSGNPASIKVYNRWGNIVFESSNYENDWDGTGRTGADLPEGTYFVIVEFENKTTALNGYIDLRR
jgi:gliding motility-associated-like protein